MKEGLRFVRRRVGCGARSLSAAIAYLAFMGPAEVLLPYVVKNELARLGRRPRARLRGRRHRSDQCAALIMGQRGHPHRDITFMYATWTLATLAIAGYGLATSVLAADARVPRLQRARDRGDDRLGHDQAAPCPASMLGRVSSLDWLISIGLLPLSFALTAPAAAPSACGPPWSARRRSAACSRSAPLFLPGMRDIEGTASTTEIDAERNPDPIADLLVGPQLARG